MYLTLFFNRNERKRVLQNITIQVFSVKLIEVTVKLILLCSDHPNDH